MKTVREEITTITTTTRTRRTVVFHDGGPGLAMLGRPVVEAQGAPVSDWAPVVDLASRRRVA